MVAGIPTWLAVPHPVAPVDIPEPFLDPRALDAVVRHDRALAAAAEDERLDTDVRLLGSALRAYGVAEAADDAAAVALERRNVAEAARRARARGDAALARLRAYELRSFLRELHRWEVSGEETDELRELGGPFLARARANGWIEGHRLLPSDIVCAALFKKRWMDLAMAQGPALDLTPPEQRALARFLLLHPPRDPATRPGRDGVARTAYLAEQYRLRKIEELRALDPSYPADLARGVVLYRLRSYPQSVEAFRQHLEANPDGPYAVRARNYLRAALGAAMEAPGE